MNKTKYNFNGITNDRERVFATEVTSSIYTKVSNAYELFCSAYEKDATAISAELDGAFELMYQAKIELDCIHGLETPQLKDFKKYCNSLFAFCYADDVEESKLKRIVKECGYVYTGFRYVILRP